MIENYPNLQSIVVKKNSLQNLNLLNICNCEKLKTIETEDCDDWGDGAFFNVKNVIIESISFFCSIMFISSKSSIIHSRRIFFFSNNYLLFT